MNKRTIDTVASKVPRVKINWFQ